MEQFIERLCEVNVVRFGNFRLSNGLETPVYVDMRLIVSYPDIMLKATELIKSMIRNIDFDVICGVPYAAVPIATSTSLATNKPLILHRREVKSYGTGRRFEGDICIGQRCLLMDDVLVAGASILESALHLKAAGMKVSDAIVLLDREQGGDRNLKSCGIKVHSLLKLSDVLVTLLRMKKIKSEEHKLILDFLANNQVQLPSVLYPYINKKHPKIPFLERSEYAKNLLTKQLLLIAGNKRSNICIDARCVNNYHDIRRLIECASSSICLIILNQLNIKNCTDLQELRAIADRHEILLCSNDNTCADTQNGNVVCNGSSHDDEQWFHLSLIKCKKLKYQNDDSYFLLDLENETMIDESLMTSMKHRLVGFVNITPPISTRCDFIYTAEYREFNDTTSTIVHGDASGCSIEIPWDMFIVPIDYVTHDLITNLKRLAANSYKDYECAVLTKF